MIYPFILHAAQAHMNNSISYHSFFPKETIFINEKKSMQEKITEIW